MTKTPPVTKILQRISKGESVRALAADYKVSVGLVYSRIRDAGVSIKTIAKKPIIKKQQAKPPYWEQEKKRRNNLIIADRRAGMSFNTIGKKHGISTQRAGQICAKYNSRHPTTPLPPFRAPTLRRIHKKTGILQEAIVASRKQGKNWHEISKKAGIGYQYTRNLYCRYKKEHPELNLPPSNTKIKIHQSERAPIRERYKNGEKLVEIAVNYGVSIASIWRIIHPEYILPRDKKRSA